MKGSTPAEVAAIKQEIAKDLAPYDALQLIADNMVIEFSGNTGRHSETAATGEYIASVLLERASPDPLESGHFVEKDGALQRTLDRVRGLTLFTISEGFNAAEHATSAVDALVEHVKVADAIHRWPAYESQIVRFLEHCFVDDRLSEALVRVVGFDGSDALACDDGVRALLEENFHAWGEHVAQAVSEGADLWDSGEMQAPMGLEASSQVKREHRRWWMLGKYFNSPGLIEALSFDEEELAEAAEIDAARAGPFVARFTTEWGSSKGLTVLRGRNEVRKAPLLRGADNRVHPTSPGNLLWALRPALEAALKSDGAAFDRYQSRRASYVEKETVRLLSDALRPDARLTNVEFELGAGNGEADALIRVDDLVLVVEVKSGQLSEASLAGRKAALRRDLDALLGKSSKQTARLEAAITAGEAIRFIDRATGEVVSFDLDGVERVRSVVVTLEDLSAVVAHPHLLHESGIVPKDIPIPWCVSLFSLEVIVESCEFTAQLTGYLDERSHLDPRALWVNEDELWVTHLLTRLDFSSVSASRFMVDGKTELLQDQWLRDRRPPRMKLPKATRKAVQRLARDRRRGWLGESEGLLARARATRRPRIGAPSQQTI